MCIHGDKQQKERDWVLNEFKKGSTTILVATDVAARGKFIILSFHEKYRKNIYLNLTENFD